MNKTITKLNKNAGEAVVISLSEFKGKELIDIRIWLRPSDPREEEEDGKLTPTKKGISMGVDFIPQLIQSLQQAQEEVEKFRSERLQDGRSQSGRGKGTEEKK